MQPAPGRAPTSYRSGFVALVRRPNAGKTTLTNRLVGDKVGIVSNRPQTTRHAIRGVVHRPEGQLVLVDTPGLHKPKSLLGQRLNDVVRDTLADVDVIVFCIPADQPATVLDESAGVQQPGAVRWPLVGAVGAPCMGSDAGEQVRCQVPGRGSRWCRLRAAGWWWVAGVGPPQSTEPASGVRGGLLDAGQQEGGQTVNVQAVVGQVEAAHDLGGWFVAVVGVGAQGNRADDVTAGHQPRVDVGAHGRQVSVVGDAPVRGHHGGNVGE